jgi:hypothetical protein
MHYLGPNAPLPLPGFPIPNPSSKVGREAERLHTAAQEATETIVTCQRTASDATEAVALAEFALNSEIERSAATGKQSPVEGKLIAAVRSAKDLANPSVHQDRIERAIANQRALVGGYRGYVQMNLRELLGELRLEAEAATQALIEAQEVLAPKRVAKDDVARRISGLIDVFAKSYDERKRWALVADDRLVPWPDELVLEDFHRRTHPEPNQPPGLEDEGVRDNSLSVAF